MVAGDVDGLSEHKRRVRMRCTGCGSESFSVLTLGLRKLDGRAVDQMVRQMMSNVPFDCVGCGSKTARLMTHFPIQPLRLC